jgi:tetratricopeptide (TPR) repeat protein
MIAGARWEQLQHLFHEALGQPKEARERFLCSAADTELRQEVAALIDAHERAGPLRILDEDNPLVVGGCVGPYRLLSPLGMGGMGVVYLAERVTADFTQRVALKLIPSSLADPRLEAQFGRERRILAQLDHPGISRFIDGGRTATGDSFIAMEYVEGTSLLEFAELRGLSVDARLRLLLGICEAMEFAHQRLVIHGDLKPANILVTPDGRPKLLDFGLAGLLEDGCVRRLPGTEMWLTPAYASPEQVRGDQLTASTDIYALGIVLYEFLAGTRPYEVDGLLPSELEYVVFSVVPEPPSSRVTGRRRRLIAGDLDAIALKALAKDPRDRYASASRLAEDLTRHLDGRPVLARVPTQAYLASKFLSRHRAVVGAAAIVAASLASAVVVTSRQAYHAGKQRDSAAQARRQSEEVTAFLLELIQANDPHRGTAKIDEPSSALLRLELARAEEFSAQPELQARLFDALGQVLVSLGQHEQGLALLERSLALQQKLHGEQDAEVAETLKHLARALSAAGEYSYADLAYRRALAIERTRLGSEDPRIALTISELGSLMPQLGRFEESQVLHRTALDLRLRTLSPDHPLVAASHMSLASSLEQLGDYAAAEALLREVLATRRRTLGPDNPDVASTLIALGDVLGKRRSGNAEAERLLRDGVAMQIRTLGNEHPEVAHGLMAHARALSRRGHGSEAEAQLRRALDLRRRVLGPQHPEVVESMEELAAELQRQNRYEEADVLRRAVLTERRRIFGPRHQSVALSLQGLASLQQARGDFGPAEESLREALRLLTSANGPSHPAVAKALAQLGILLAERGAVVEAEPMLLQARDILSSKLRPNHIDVQGVNRKLARFYATSGRRALTGRDEPLTTGASDSAANPQAPEPPWGSRL